MKKIVTLTVLTQSAFTCLKLTIETVEQGVIYVNNKDTRMTPLLFYTS